MPIIKSAVKRAKQTKIRTARNKVTKQNMRSGIKALMAAIESGDKKNAQEQLRVTQGAIDTAVKKNIIHKNRASRKKSQLNEKVKSMGATETKPKTTAAKKKTAPKKTAAKKTS